MPDIPSVTFAPVLYVREVLPAMQFYERALNAKEVNRFSNEDESVHVAEMIIENCVFHIHEETARSNELSPETLKGTPVVLGLFVADPDALFEQALKAGAIEMSPMQDYDYGLRQGKFIDPFRHYWVMQKRI